MQTPPRTPWMEISLIILGLIGLLFYWGVAALMVISGLLGMSGTSSAAEASQPFVLGTMFGFIGLLLVPGLWTAFQKLQNRIEPDGDARLPFALWHIPLILIAWAAGLFAGQWAVDAPSPAWILLPILIPLCVVPPIWLIMGLAGRGYHFRPRWRNWNALTIGTTFGPFVILIVEVIVLGTLLAAVVLFIMSQPEMMEKMQALAFRMQYAQSEEAMLALMGPLVASPGFIGTLLFAVSLLVPLVEELLKPLAVWIFARRLETRLDGFVLGALCGAAYALFETGGLGAAAGGDWLLVLGARGGTSLLHIATSAWMGSAIVPAIRERKIVQLFGVYALSIFLHGTWNALSIFSGLGAAANGQPGAGWLVAAGKFAPFGMGALAAVLLALVIFQQNRFQDLHNQKMAMAIAPVADLPASESENPETVIR